ncbi:MAG TPA: MBL fold metallo-hydrolase [Rhodocyclaceae bacterium]|jgi:glyoxylase-like metal-dependent hydrolase (beta-lactamase superfamily II)|nr:MBL fold metallo-hydrolase [Rhodocyclaceae bacterium]
MSGIAYLFGETLPPPASAMEVRLGVRWIRMPLPYALNHINLWLIEDGERWCAIDTGLDMGDVKAHWQTLLAHYPLSRIIATHYHPDHVGLAGWLHEQTDAPLAMTQAEYMSAVLYAKGIDSYAPTANIELFRRHGLDDSRVEAMRLRGNAYGRNVPTMPPTYSILQEGQHVRIGKHDWRVIIGRGHCPEHASLYAESLGVLICGDMLLPSITPNIAVFAPNPDDDALGNFLQSIRAFADIPDDVLVLPSHGRPYCGARARVEALEAHHIERCDMLVDACRDAPQTACSLIPVLFKRDISDPHQVLFAMSEAIAHLNYLERRGALTRCNEGGVFRYHA